MVRGEVSTLLRIHVDDAVHEAVLAPLLAKMVMMRALATSQPRSYSLRVKIFASSRRATEIQDLIA